MRKCCSVFNPCKSQMYPMYWRFQRFFDPVKQDERRKVFFSSITECKAIVALRRNPFDPLMIDLFRLNPKLRAKKVLKP